MTGLEKLINLDLDSITETENNFGPGLKKLIETGKRIDYVENILNEQKSNGQFRQKNESGQVHQKEGGQVRQKEGGQAEDPFSADYWLRQNFSKGMDSQTEAQKDSAYRAEKSNSKGMDTQNVIGNLISQAQVKDNSQVIEPTGILNIIQASKEKRFTPLQINQSNLYSVPDTKFVKEAPRKAQSYLSGYIEKLEEGIKSVPENLADALRKIYQGRENIRKGIRQITGQEKVKDIYTIYNDRGEEITNTSDPETANLYKEQGYRVKSRYWDSIPSEEEPEQIPAGLKTAARGLGEQAAGAIKGIISSIPAVMGFTAVMPVATKIGGDIAESLGYDRKKGEEITNIIAPFAFGPGVGIGSLLSSKGTEELQKAGAFDSLNPTDREIAKELVENGLFFGTILGIKGAKIKLDKTLEKKINEGLEEAFKNKTLVTPYQGLPIIPSERIPLSKTAEKVIEASKNLKGRTPEEEAIIQSKLEKLAPTSGELFFGEKPVPKEWIPKIREKEQIPIEKTTGVKGLLESNEIKNVRKLAEDIVKGKTKFTSEELQLQKNYPKLLEEEIKRIGGENAEGIRSNKGLLSEERTASEEGKGISSQDIQQKTPAETIERLSRSEREDAEKAKEILTTLPVQEVIKEAKNKLGKDFENEFNNYLKLPNNKARLNNAEDKELEKGLLLEDFARRTLAADLLGADVDSDLYGLAEQKLKLINAEERLKENVIGAESGKAVKIKFPEGVEKIFVMGEGSHKDPLAIAFRYLTDDLIKKGMDKEKAEEFAENYITSAAINEELDIGDFREGKFIISYYPKAESRESIPSEKELKTEIDEESATEEQSKEKTKPIPKETKTTEEKKPYEMTAEEWNNERERLRAETRQEKFTKRSGAEELARINKLQKLLYGVTDEAKQKIEQASKGEIKLSEQELETYLNRLNTPVTHRDVVEKALKEGKKIPEEVLKDYPDLQKIKTETPSYPKEQVKPLEIIDEETYLAKNKAPFMGGAEPALHKNIQEGRGKQQAIKKVSEEMQRNNQRREELRKEYADKVAKGEIRPPTRIEKLVDIANGHPDLESTQAARRILEKQGVDWKNPDLQTKTEKKEPNINIGDRVKLRARYVSGHYIPDKFTEGEVLEITEFQDTPTAIVKVGNEEWIEPLDKLEKIEKFQRNGFPEKNVAELLYGEPKGKAENKKVIEPEIKKAINETVANKETASKGMDSQKEIENKFQETKFAEVKEIPIREIKTDESRFQNRAESYSEETARAIEKNYNPAAFDPIIVWKDPKDNNIYVLAGHSRLEGMKRRNAKTIPVKFFEGTEEEAINYAIIESNRKSTQENLLSDIKAYKRAKQQGYSKSKLLDIFKKESRIKLLDNLSYLNEEGEFIRALNSEAAKSYPYLERNASWVGELRKQFPQITDGHEQELFDYFYRDKLRNSFITKEEFFNKVEDRVTDITFKPNEKLALDKLESTGARARADTRDIQKKIDLLRARNRELTALSKGAPLEQKNLFQKEILANTEEIKKLENNISEIINNQFDIFEQLEKSINRGEIDEEIATQIITSGDAAELEKLAEDIESKTKAAGRISEEEIRQEINKTGQILYQKYIEYKDSPRDEIEIALLRAYNSFDHELPVREKLLTLERYTQKEEIQRALASFLNNFVERKRFENVNVFIRRAIKEKPELIKSYTYLKDKLNEAVKNREKDSNLLLDYREKITEGLPASKLEAAGIHPFGRSQPALIEQKELAAEPTGNYSVFDEGRSEIQSLQDRKRHLEYVIEEAKKKNDFETIQKAENELETVNKKILKLKNKNVQYELFGGEQQSLFQKNTEEGKAEIYKKIINDKEIEYNNDLKELGFDINKDNWEKNRLKITHTVRKYYKKIHPKSVINKDTGKEIFIGRESEKKPFTHVGRYEQLVVNKNTPGILRDAIYIGELKNEKNIKGYDKFEYFLKSVKIDGKDFTVKISVGVDNTGKWHYDNSTLEINRNDLLYIVRLNNLSSQQAVSKFTIKDTNLRKLLQEIISAHENKLEQTGEAAQGLRRVSIPLEKVYVKMSDSEKKKFLEEIRKGINSEWLIGQKDLSKEQAKGLTDLIEKTIIFDPEKADITTAWEESFHASIITLAKPHLARNLLRENGWNGKGEIWDVANNPSLKEAHERLAKKYIEWREQQEKNPSEPRTRLERLFQLLRELWSKIAYYLNKLGFSFEAGYFYSLASGKIKKISKTESTFTKEEINTEVSLAQSNFNKKVDDLLNGKTTQPVIITNTPLILVKLGAKQLPITITKEVINKAITKDNLTLDLIKDLPKELHDPIMIFKSATMPNSFVIMTELRGEKGNVIAAIHLSRQEQNHIVNKIANIYSKERDKTFIEWIEKGLLRYYNKNKSQIWLQSRGLQLPKEVTKSGHTKILTEEDFVNDKLRQKISEIQGELYPKDLEYYLNRIEKIKNIFELKNWKKKHEAEIDELPAWDKEEIIYAWNKRHKDFTGQEGNWKTAEAKQKNKHENTKEAYKKYLPEASEIYDEGFRRYTDFSEKIKEKAGNISPDDILKLYREVIKAKLREYEKGKEETGTFVEPKTDITDKKAEEIKKEIEKYLINKNIPAETQEKILQTAEEIINDPKNRIGKFSKIIRLTYFGEKGKIMTMKYGAAGAELFQRMAKGVIIQGRLLEKYFQINNKIEDIYDNIRSEEYGEQRIKEIKDKIINALEDRANYKEYLETDDEIKLYELYKMIYGDKDMNDGLYAEIKKAGYPVRTDYFPHIIRDGFIIDEIISDPKDIIKTDVRGLNNFIYADSRYLKPREFDIKDIKRDLSSITRNYIFSVAKALAYKDAVNYYYTDFKKDIPELLKKQGFSTAIEFMRAILNPELPSKNLAAKFFREIRSAEYMNFLSFSLKNAVQNYTQKDFARLYMTNEAVKLTDKIFYKLKTPTGNLLNAMHEASQETPRFLELTAEEANRSKILKINEMIKNYEPFHLAEMTNWRYAELGGIIDYVTKQKAYKDLINKGMGEIEAINKVLEDKKMFDMAVRNGMDLAANSQISPTAAYRPSLFDKEIVRFFLMFRRFPITHLEHLSQTLFKSLEGAEGLRAQRILRRGLSEDVKTVEALRAVEYFRKAMDIMIDKIKNKKDYKDYEIGTIEEMRDWLKQQEKILNKTIEKLEPIKNKSEIIYHWSKYYAKMLMISTLFQFLYDIMDRMFKQIINGDDEEKRMQDLLKSGRLTEKQKRALITELAFKSIFDSMPLPAYGLNPANLMITPLIPKVEIFPYGNYSIFNERGIVKSIASWGLNIVPGLGLVDRVTGRVLSNKITDIISPKQERKNQIKMIPPGRGRVNERPGLGR